jgi:hypothetical protein
MASQQSANADHQATIFNVLIDFWSKITPSVLQLVAHSSVVITFKIKLFFFLNRILKDFLDFVF